MAGVEETGKGEVAPSGMKTRRFLWRRSERERESRREGDVREKESIGIPRYRYTRVKSKIGRRGRKKKEKWTPRSNEEDAGG